ncbi:hypothetical protein [Nostoc sp.]
MIQNQNILIARAIAVGELSGSSRSISDFDTTDLKVLSAEC